MCFNINKIFSSYFDFHRSRSNFNLIILVMAYKNLFKLIDLSKRV